MSVVAFKNPPKDDALCKKQIKSALAAIYGARNVSVREDRGTATGWLVIEIKHRAGEPDHREDYDKVKAIAKQWWTHTFYNDEGERRSMINIHFGVHVTPEMLEAERRELEEFYLGPTPANRSEP